MIDLTIEPPSLVAEAARIVTVSVGNPERRAYTNLVVALDIPPELGLEQGRSRIEWTRLGPGEVREHALRIRPLRPGLFTIKFPNLSYRDGSGQARRQRGRFIEIEVAPPVDGSSMPPPPAELRTRRTNRPSIFVSYRRSDAKMIVPGLIRDLGRRKALRHVDFFLDLTDIRAGTPWNEALQRELRKCAALIAIIGPNWLNATGADGGRRIADPEDIVRREIATALRRGVPVLPLLVDAPMPDRSELPEDIRLLRSWHYFAFDLARYGRSVDDLSKELLALLRGA